MHLIYLKMLCQYYFVLPPKSCGLSLNIRYYTNNKFCILGVSDWIQWNRLLEGLPEIDWRLHNFLWTNLSERWNVSTFRFSFHRNHIRVANVASLFKFIIESPEVCFLFGKLSLILFFQYQYRVFYDEFPITQFFYCIVKIY